MSGHYNDLCFINKLKPFPQHFGGGHVMEVIRCRCSYLHRHPLQMLHSVSWEIRFGEEGSHSPCSPLLVASYDKQRILWLNSITRP